MNPDLTAGSSSAMEILKVFLRRVEKTCKQLAAIQAAGTPAEKRRATAALVAFNRATGRSRNWASFASKWPRKLRPRPNDNL